jgi:ATP-dependent Clp protease protease subunit
MKKLFQMLRANAAEVRTPIQAKAEGDSATLYMYDVIDADYGINAIEFAGALSGLDPNTTINLRINSPGGDVFEARAIATAIKGYAGKVVAHIDGLAASAATTIAAAADEVIIAEGSFYMIHNAWTLAMGDKNDFNQTAALLDKIDGAIAADYAARTGKSVEDIAALMDAETWMTAQEAVDNKFADSMAPTPKAKNVTTKKWNLSAFDRAPEALTKYDEDDFAAQRQRNANRLRLLQID